MLVLEMVCWCLVCWSGVLLAEFAGARDGVLVFDMAACRSLVLLQ